MWHYRCLLGFFSVDLPVWKFPHMSVWVVIVIASIGCLCSFLRLRDLYQREFTWYCRGFFCFVFFFILFFLNGAFLGSVHTCRFFHMHVTECIRCPAINPLHPVFVSFYRSALLKSSGRMRRLKAGGLRRVSRSGCWWGWRWWQALWRVRLSRKNACEPSRSPVVSFTTLNI